MHLLAGDLLAGVYYHVIFLVSSTYQPFERQPQRTARATKTVVPEQHKMSKCLFLFSAIPWLIIGVLLASSFQLTSSDGWHGFRFSTPNSFESLSPFSPSWSSWWHPNSETNQRIYDPNKWNLLYHLGGYGPWIERLEGLVTTQDAGIGPPKGCIVDGVHMVLLSLSSVIVPIFLAPFSHNEVLLCFLAL